ncbi:MAG: hypothetical protein AVDCRST_MAG02-2521 [uncultured Rubrobacteraceae bacterium]|uniref:Uncharacterized protein n=1 Tax=uncultured Rubrobacteraceae bacterium TaxID=349277 RepID=A0A6J4R2G8_9ACTN|nr:MAG: hypothetical protein AVDCRST_MAG02-2521 [uncultured Rubrobacteraceae bacterium]
MVREVREEERRTGRAVGERGREALAGRFHGGVSACVAGVRLLTARGCPDGQDEQRAGRVTASTSTRTR